MSAQKMIRAIYRSVATPDHDSPGNAITVKIHYPGLYGDSEEERNSGTIPVDPDFGAMPVAIIAPGINLSLESYAWLATALAEKGIVTACYQLVGETMPGETHLTPALDVAATFADSGWEKPCGFGFQPLLDLLARENETGLLAGALDLSSVWFGGHSAGGTTALLSANRNWFAGLQGVFSYGAHTGLSTMLGYPENYVHPIADIPVLLVGGTSDGCIANSAHRYGSTPGDASARIVQTFDKAVTSDSGASILAIVEGANHFTFAHPFDPGTGRGFIDFEERCDGDAARSLIAQMVAAFINGDRAALGQLITRAEIAEGRQK